MNTDKVQTLELISRCRWTLCLLLAALLAGCSALRLGYNQADIILAWRANDYFDLDPDQRHEFNQRLDRLLEWHRYEQLPEYAAFTAAAINKARSGLKREDLIWFIDGIKTRYQVVVDYGAADAAGLLATVTPEQIKMLQQQWDKDNRKFVREHELKSTFEQRKRARLKRTLDQIEDWTGSLTLQQEQKIALLLEPIPHVNHLRHQDRLRRQKEFLELLKLRGNKQEFPAKLHTWLRDWERGRSPEYDKLSAEVYERRLQFYLAVEKLLTPDQRRHALRRLQNFGDDFKALSERSQRTKG